MRTRSPLATKCLATTAPKNPDVSGYEKHTAKIGKHLVLIKLDNY